MSIMGRKLRVVPDRGLLIAGAIVLFCLIQLPADPVIAAVYECKGINGSKVLTDRPKGLQGCVIIETLAPSPSTGAARTEAPTLGQSQDNPAASVPFPVIPQSPPQPMPHEPIQAGNASDQSTSSSGQESKPCPPGINPLNPLARGHCSPGASPSPDATQEPQQSPQ